LNNLTRSTRRLPFVVLHISPGSAAWPDPPGELRPPSYSRQQNPIPWPADLIYHSQPLISHIHLPIPLPPPPSPTVLAKGCSNLSHKSHGPNFVCRKSSIKETKSNRKSRNGNALKSFQKRISFVWWLKGTKFLNYIGLIL